MNHRCLPIICSALLFSIGSAHAQTNDALPAEVSKKITDFFTILKKGDTAGAIDLMLSSSSLWEKTPVRAQMNAQLATASQLYGPLISYECLVTYKTGTLVLRQYCFAQHQELVLRWQFDFSKTGRGWMPSYFAFTDQSNAWPDTP